MEGETQKAVARIGNRKAIVGRLAFRKVNETLQTRADCRAGHFRFSRPATTTESGTSSIQIDLSS